jgi:hypothetical protein
MQQNQRVQKKPLTPLPVTGAVGLAYLHWHAAARARITIRSQILRLLLSTLTSHRVASTIPMNAPVDPLMGR